MDGGEAPRMVSSCACIYVQELCIHMSANFYISTYLHIYLYIYKYINKQIYIHIYIYVGLLQASPCRSGVG